MRVDHVTASIDDLTAGTSYSVRQLARDLDYRGIETKVHAIGDWRGSERDAGPLPTLKSSLVVRHPRTMPAMPGLSQLCWSEPMRKALRASADATDILHSHGLWLMPNMAPAWAVRAADRPRARLVASPRGMLGRAALKFSSRRKNLVWHLAQRSALAAAHCLHATSDSEKDEIRALGFSAPIAVVPNGIEVLPLGPKSQPSRTVLSLGRLHPKKGLEDLLKAWQAVQAAEPAWSLKIVGDGDHEYIQSLRALANTLALGGFSIGPPVFGEQKTALMREADVFVLPTLNENFGIVVGEALAAGTPVVCSQGAPWKGLVDHDCGWWVPVGWEGIAMGLRLAMEASVDQRIAMGQRGRAWMLREFGWTAVAEQMEQLYRWVISGGDSPAFVEPGRAQ